MKDAMTDHKAEWVLVPARFGISADAWEAAAYSFGGPATGEGEAYMDCTAWIGECMDDDGKPVHGLHIACDECPEEGSTTIATFPAAPAASEEEDGAVAAVLADARCVASYLDHASMDTSMLPGSMGSALRRMRQSLDGLRITYTRPAAQVAATPKHDEGRDDLVAALNREADAHDYFAANADLRMTTGDHASRAKKIRAVADQLAARATQPAARRVTDAERLLTDLVNDMEALIGESSGVYGLHLNGDPSPWAELLPGGRFERFSTLYDAGELVNSFAQPAEGVSGG